MQAPDTKYGNVGHSAAMRKNKYSPTQLEISPNNTQPTPAGFIPAGVGCAVSVDYTGCWAIHCAQVR